MFGLIVVGIILGYLVLAIIATFAVVRWARKRKLSRIKEWLAGGSVALIFYLIPLWDLIPTVLAHSYYCATDGRFEVFKTVEQWKSENKDVLGDLRFDRDAKITRADDYYRFPLNQRLVSERKDPVPIFLSIKREEGRIVDVQNGDVLVKYVDFLTGYPPLGVGGEGSWKFWLRNIGRCRGESRGIGTFELIRREIKDLGSKK